MTASAPPMDPAIGKILCARHHGAPEPAWPIIPIWWQWFGIMWILPTGCGAGQLDEFIARLDPDARFDWQMRMLAFELGRTRSGCT